MSKFSIYTDESQYNQENRPTSTTARHGKQIESGLPAAKRTALGASAIGNASRTRVQPSRAAKSVSAEAVSSNSGFSVYREPHNEPDKQKPRRVAAKQPRVGIKEVQAKAARQGVAEVHLSKKNKLAVAISRVDALPDYISSVLDIEHDPEAHFQTSQYATEIYEYLQSFEIQMMPNPSYIKQQRFITGEMRAILVDWLVEVGCEYKLHEETLFLAVNYIDRFLSKSEVKREKLQLVGTVAMFIASKYEEIYPPDANDFIYVTDHSYDLKRLKTTEEAMLKCLQFLVSPPTSHWFATRLMTVIGMGPGSVESHLTYYLLELALVDSSGGLSKGLSFLKFRPSVLGAAAVAFARHMRGLTAWTGEMGAATGYGSSVLTECYKDLQSLHASAGDLAQQSVQTKYSQPKYMKVSELRYSSGYSLE